MLSGAAPNRLHHRRARVFGQLRSRPNAYATEAGYDYVLIDCPPNFNIVTKKVVTQTVGRRLSGRAVRGDGGGMTAGEGD